MGFPSYKDPDPSLLSHLMGVYVGQGKLLITTFQFDLIHEPGFKERTRNYATEYFFDQMLRCLASGESNPKADVSEDFIQQYINKDIRIPTQEPSW